MPTFPDQDLEITVRAAFGADLTAAPSTWAWTDLSDRQIRAPITVKTGVVVGAASSATSSASVQLLNDDGELTMHHPGSDWWPYVDAGTPMDVSVRTDTSAWIQDGFGRTVSGGLGTADSGQVWAGGNPSTFNATGSTATHVATATAASRTIRIPLAHRDFDAAISLSVPTVATGNSILSGMTARNTGTGNYLFCAVEFRTGGTVKVALYSMVGNVTFTLLTDAVVPGLTYSGGTLIQLRTMAIGQRIRLKAWLASGSEPSAWTIDTTLADGQFTSGAAWGLAAFLAVGNSNTLPYTVTFDSLLVQQPKYALIEGYIADVKNTFRPIGDGTSHSIATIDIGGIGSLLDRLNADTLSPVRRSIQNSVTPPLAYWPLEDAEGSQSATSAFPDQQSMVVTGPIVFAFDTGEPDDVLISKYGTKSLTSVAAGAKLTATVKTGATGAWTISITTNVFSRAVTPPVSEIRILEWTTPSAGAYTRWALICTSTGHQVRAYNDSAVTVTNVVTVADNYAALITFDVTAVQNGPNIDVTLWYSGGSATTGSVAGTVTPINRATINPDRANVTGSTDPYGIRYLVGHLVVTDASVVTLPYYVNNGDLYRGDFGWYREPDHLRIGRLCAEADIPFRLLATPTADLTTRLNSQQEGTTSSLTVAAAEASSGAILAEAEFGYTYLPRPARYNAAVDLTVDLSTYRYSDGTDAEEILTPVLDLKTPNWWTVERTGGGSGSYAAATSYRNRRGTIQDKATLDLLYDADCAQHAAWRVHTGVDGQGGNYPTAILDLAANPGLIDAWLLCRPGSRIQRTNPPTIADIEAIDQVIEGYSQTVGPRTWLVTPATSPAAVWQVGVYDSPAFLVDAATTTVGVALTTGSASVVFSSTDKGDTWSTTPGYTVTVNGEDMLVTFMGAQTGSGPWTQTATVTRGVNGVLKAHKVGTEIHVKSPLRWAL